MPCALTHLSRDQPKIDVQALKIRGRRNWARNDHVRAQPQASDLGDRDPASHLAPALDDRRRPYGSPAPVVPSSQKTTDDDAVSHALRVLPALVRSLVGQRGAFTQHHFHRRAVRAVLWAWATRFVPREAPSRGGVRNAGRPSRTRSVVRIPTAFRPCEAGRQSQVRTGRWRKTLASAPAA